MTMHINRYLTLAAALAVLSAAARTETVQNWRDSKNYPARVDAFQWKDRKLDAGHPVRFGSWTIRFTSEPPRAQWEHEGSCRSITIDEFVCSSPKIADKACRMVSFVYGCERPTRICVVGQIHSEDFKIMNDFDIPCPSALDLAH
jgi:hypothetical protein